MLLCIEVRASLIWEEELKKFETWMQSQDIHPEIIQMVITGMKSWITQKPTYVVLLQNPVQSQKV